MSCNCNKQGDNAIIAPNIKHVQGNVLRLAIPLTLRTIEIVDGEVKHTDTDFVPSSAYPVNVVFSKGAAKYAVPAVMQNGNVAYIEDKGKIPTGTFDITVTCCDDNGDPYRFEQDAILQVFNSTKDAGIESSIEFEVETWYLDAAIYLALKGEDGVGIEDIETESSDEIGGFNRVTFILTDGRTKTFTVMNGSGSVDEELDINSRHPIANSTVTNAFNNVASEIGRVFGGVDYDPTNRIIRFFAKGADKIPANIIAYLDASPFISDDSLQSVYISGNYIVMKTQARTFSINMSLLFTNYYNKSQIDNMLANIDVDVDGYAELDEHTRKLKHWQASAVVLDAIVFDDEEPPVGEGPGVIYGTIDGHIIACVLDDVDTVSYDLGVAPHLVFTNKRDNKQYRWTGSAWQQVGGSSGGYTPPTGGIPKTDLAPAVQTSLGLADTALQQSDLDGYATTDDVDDAVAALVDSSPTTLDTLNELAQALGDDPNFATTMTTALGNKVDKENGKSLMTDAERTKLAGIAAGAEANVQSDWNQSDSSADDFIKNKPTIPAAYDDTALAGRVSVLENAGYITTETDPTVPAWAKQSTKPTYTAQEVGALPANTTIPTKVSDLTNDSGYTTNTGTVTGISVNGGATQQPTNGVVSLSIPIGSDNDLVGVSVPSPNDGTIIFVQRDGDTITVDLNHEHPQYVKYVLCADEAAYNAITNKDSGTLYLIPES